MSGLSRASNSTTYFNRETELYHQFVKSSHPTVKLPACGIMYNATFTFGRPLAGMMFIMLNYAGHIGFTLHLSSPGSTKYLAWSYV